MATKKQIESNRQNAQKSSGPKTEQGKKNTGSNALKHGLFSTSPVISDPRFKESQEEYDLLKESLTEELKPVSTLQTHLVQKITDALWRYRRVVNAEKSEATASEKDRSKELFIEYFEAGGLSRLGRDPNALTPQQYSAKRTGESDEPKSPPIPSGSSGLNLWRYESRLDRQLHRAFRMYRILQRFESPKRPKKAQKIKMLNITKQTQITAVSLQKNPRAGGGHIRRGAKKAAPMSSPKGK